MTLEPVLKEQCPAVNGQASGATAENVTALLEDVHLDRAASLAPGSCGLEVAGDRQPGRSQPLRLERTSGGS